MKNRKRAKKVIKTIFIIVLCVAVGIGIFAVYGNYQMSKIPNLSFEDTIKYTTKNNPDAVITVGIIKDGKMSYKVYGENGKELSPELHTYEIGSLTKTFTGSLISKAVQEGKIKLSDPIDKYLNLPKKDHYPTIEQLLTHTSGYDGFYFAKPMISNFFTKKNDFYGATGKYNSYLGFNPDTQTGVVILSNLSPNYRIPATVSGVKLLKSIQK